MSGKAIGDTFVYFTGLAGWFAFDNNDYSPLGVVFLLVGVGVFSFLVGCIVQYRTEKKNNKKGWHGIGQ